MGLSTDGLLYALGYASLSRTYLDQGPNGFGQVSVRMVLQGFPENSTPLHKIATDGRADFLQFYKRHSFGSLPDFYKSIAVNVTELREITSETESESPFVLHSCWGCDVKHELFKKVILFDNAICYAFPLNNKYAHRYFGHSTNT